MPTRRRRSSRRPSARSLQARIDASACTVFPPQHGSVTLTAKQCEKFKPSQKIGQGQYAAVYDRKGDPDRVSKFTTDTLDAKAASILKGKKYRHLVRVDEVKELKGKPGVYGIIAEKLSTGSAPNTSATLILFKTLDDYLYFRRKGEIAKTESLSSVVTDDLPKACKSEWGFFLGVPFASSRKATASDAEECRSHLKQMVTAVDEAIHAGLITQDLHRGNWGMRGNDRVILDFGHSTKFHKVVPPIGLAGLRRSRKKRK